jgi:hypothetical protein
MRDIGHRASSSHNAGVNDEDEDEDFDNGTDDAAKEVWRLWVSHLSCSSRHSSLPRCSGSYRHVTTQAETIRHRTSCCQDGLFREPSALG